MVVEVVITQNGYERYRLASKAGIVDTTYASADIRKLPLATPKLHKLDKDLEEWRGLPKLGLRATMRSPLTSGIGQGMLNCLCRSTCLMEKRACRKDGRICNSRCHKGHTCENRCTLASLA